MTAGLLQPTAMLTRVIFVTFHFPREIPPPGYAAIRQNSLTTCFLLLLYVK